MNLALAILLVIAARFSTDWTRFVDIVVALVLLYRALWNDLHEPSAE